SRRSTDELHDTRPKWLRKISRGANRILFGVVLAIAWPFLFALTPLETLFQPTLFQPLGVLAYARWFIPLAVWYVAVVMLLWGSCLLTASEGYPPADRADRKLRWLVRISGV